MDLAAVGRLVGLALIALLAAPQPGQAQSITIDGSLSPAWTLVGPGYTIGPGLGKQVGGNLFQSFGKFGLNTGESATFAGPRGIANIIGRVTGGSPSSIDGAIRSAIAGANLFLINPFGMVFGPNATVNVSGSFHASTADYLKMADGSLFQATHPSGSTLGAAPPAAFGFLSARPAAITVNGSNLGPVPRTLGLVGGPVTISGGSLTAPGGAIHIVSAASAGEIPVDPAGGPVATVAAYGPVAITSGATLDVSDPSGFSNGGSVFIRAGTLTIDGSNINADNYGAGAGGRLSLQADRQIIFESGADLHAISHEGGNGADIVIATSAAGSISLDHAVVRVGTLKAGSSGDLSVNGGQVSLTDGAAFRSITSGSGTGGEIIVTAGTVVLDGGPNLNTQTGMFSSTNGAGDGGSISLVTGQLALHNGAGVLARTSGDGAGGAVGVTVAGALAVDSGASLGTVASGIGNAGNVSVDAAGSVTIDMTVGYSPSVLDGIGSYTYSDGRAGDVKVSAGNLSITNGGSIGSDTFGAGNSGDVLVAISGFLSIDGISQATPFTGITAGSERKSIGHAGNVTVSAGALSIVRTGEISSDTFGSGGGGSVNVTVAGAASIASGGGVLTDSENAYSGDAGSVTVTAGELSIANGGSISSVTFGAGNSGTVSVDVPGLLSIVGTPAKGVTSFTTGIYADSEPSGAGGNAGSVTVTAGDLSIATNAEIASGTFGSGMGGTVSVTVAGLLSIDALSANRKFITGITAQTQGSGDAGSVAVNAAELSLTNGGEILSTTFGAGNAGIVSVAVAGLLSIDGDQHRQGLTDISSAAYQGSTGNAGTVSVTAGELLISSNGAITSSTSGSGEGGIVSVSVAGLLSIDGSSANSAFPTGITSQSQGGGNAGSVTVNAGQLSITSNGSISSNTSGVGNGGDVELTAGTIILSGAGSLITAQSTGTGAAGSIAVTAGAVDLLDGGSISTAAATANGGNILLSVGDLLYLRQGAITTSVNGAFGNGGNLTIAAPHLVLDDSRIIAQAVGGNGGNITVVSEAFVPSFDSLVSASSQKAVSGTVTISGEESGLNASLVVLSSGLRAPEAIQRTSCAARGARPQSSLTEAGRGGLPEDPEVALPALYLALRPVAPAHAAAPPSFAPLQTGFDLSTNCG